MEAGVSPAQGVPQGFGSIVAASRSRIEQEIDRYTHGLAKRVPDMSPREDLRGSSGLGSVQTITCLGVGMSGLSIQTRNTYGSRDQRVPGASLALVVLKRPLLILCFRGFLPFPTSHD